MAIVLRLTAAAALLGMVLPGGLAPAAPAVAGTAPQQVVGRTRGAFDPDVRRAVESGLAWLVKRQKFNGAWENRVGYKLYDSYYGQEAESVAVTSLACMALVSAGNVPGRGKYGRNVDLGVRWLVSKVRPEDGYVTHAGSRMYSHAFATMFLAEIYGMTGRKDIKPHLKGAVNLLVNSQNEEGGWRYQPTPVDADLSVTVSCLQALRAARNVGIKVPRETVDRAMEYVSQCATSLGFTYQTSGYQQANDARHSFALTACGIVAMQSAGFYGRREIETGLRMLPTWRRQLRPGRLHYYYGHYYASQAYYMAGAARWENYYVSVRDEILADPLYRRKGYWDDDVGAPYATAMACIILQMPCEYLPIFQK